MNTQKFFSPDVKHFPAICGGGANKKPGMTDVKSFSKFKKTKIISNNTMLCVSNLVFVFCFMMMHLAWAQSSGWLEKPNKNVVKTDTSGNVGAGVLNPTEKLDVNGNIRVRALEGDTDRIVIVDRFGKLKTINLNLGIFEVPTPKKPILLGACDIVPQPSWNPIMGTIPILHTCPPNTRVGIGTDSPERSLHIRGGDGAVIIDAATVGTDPALWLTHDNFSSKFNNGILASRNNQSVYIRANGITTATFKNGDVGIGTTSPGTKLHIENNGNVRITLKDASNPTGRYFQIEQDGDLVSFNDDGVKQIISMNLTSGNVGIGTTGPGSPLEIVKTTNGTQDLITIDNASFANGVSVDAGIRFRNDGNQMARIFTERDNNNFNIQSLQSLSSIRFLISATLNSGEKMRIDQNGNVGIGTTDPQGFKLNVNGTIRACKVKVDMSGCDFVFENDYSLMTLKKRKEITLKNKRLWNIKPAKDMEENGADLGELSTGILQITEEHELYLYQHDDKIENLLQRVDKLEKKNEELEKENEKLFRELKLHNKNNEVGVKQ